MRPDISIIVPNKDGGNTLRKCFDSILTQNLENFEVLICDGESKDSSLQIIKEYCMEDKRFKLISNSDTGQANAINKGIAASKARYLTWLNSEDELYCDPLCEAINIMEKNLEINIVYGSVLDVDLLGRIIKLNPGLNLHVDELPNYYFFPQAGTVTRNIPKIYLDDTLYWGLDWDFFIRVSTTGYIYNTNKIMARCIIEDENRTRKSANLTIKRSLELWGIRKKYGRCGLISRIIFFYVLLMGVLLFPCKLFVPNYYHYILKVGGFLHKIFTKKVIVL